MIKFRSAQTLQLSQLLDDVPPPCIVIQGLPDTGKTLTVSTLLRTLPLKYHIVDCAECASKKGLVGRIASSIVGQNDCETTVVKNSVITEDFLYRCNSVDGLVDTLQQLYRTNPSLGEVAQVVVLDNLTSFIELDDTFIYSLAKFHQQSQLDKICFIMVFNSPMLPQFFHTEVVPLTVFAQYTDVEAKQIVAGHVLDENTSFVQFKGEMVDLFQTRSKFEKFVNSFVSIVCDCVSSFTVSRLDVLFNCCRDMWHPFVEPLKNKTHSPADILKIYQLNKKLLNVDSLVGGSIEVRLREIEMPTMTKYLIVGSFLASYNEAKYDLAVFSKLRDVRAKRLMQGYRNKSGISRLSMMSAQPFELERLLAIYSAIYQQDTDDYPVNNVDLMASFSSLVSLRMIVKVGAGSLLDGNTKWKCNVNDLDYVNELARSVNVELNGLLLG